MPRVMPAPQRWYVECDSGSTPNGRIETETQSGRIDGRRHEVLEPDGGWDVALDGLDWDYRVLAPIVDGVAVIGDPALYVTAGDLRVHHVAGTTVGLVGPDDDFELVVWSEDAGVQRRPISIGANGWVDLDLASER